MIGEFETTKTIKNLVNNNAWGSVLNQLIFLGFILKIWNGKIKMFRGKAGRNSKVNSHWTKYKKQNNWNKKGNLFN